MNAAELRESTQEAKPPLGIGSLLEALWHEARGDWDRAHRIVQDIGTAEAAWVHAYLHRVEGDEGNAGYWYKRANRPRSNADLDDEWYEVAESLCSALTGDPG
ncbi:MAG: hypothetical protein ACR2RL_26655 [Gammaproteobacteria bacterium]